jgi:hypothetical protein
VIGVSFGGILGKLSRVDMPEIRHGVFLAMVGPALR